MKILVKLLVFCVLSKLYECIPRPKIEWGVPRRRINNLLVGGKNAIAQDFPWHATLFRKDETSNDQWNYACGGSLISERFVLTAEHCTLVENTNNSLPVEKLFIKFGLQRYNETNENTQSREVTKVYYPKGNLWEEMRNDIALVELKTKVQVTDHVLPVLIVDREPTVGKKGTVAGFGFTENLQTSLMLQRLSMPVVDPRPCTNRHKFNMDLGQLCAGHTDNRTACNGDSGSGLVFRINDKFYLGGLVSYSEVDYDTYSCKFDGYSVFTNVYYYVPWINRITKLNVSLANYPEPNDQTCGVSKVRRFRRIVGGQKAVPGQWPWHVKIYYKEFAYRYGGTLISAKFIITQRLVRNPDQYRVQLGASQLEEPNRDFYDVEKYYEPQGEKFVGYEEDIALLQLSNEVVIIYTDFVRPVCLPKADIEIGAFGTAIGFGETEEGELSTDLRMVQLPIIDSTRCKNAHSYHANDTFCAGYYYVTGVRWEDLGGGIHFKGDNDEWYIGGVTIRPSCYYSETGLFKNVFKYLPWIQSVMNSNSLFGQRPTQNRPVPPATNFPRQRCTVSKT